MGSEYLKAAEQVLRHHRVALTVKDILHKCVDEENLKTNGSTPVNTMRARLAEHIKLFKEDSVFVRVGPNKIALREWGEDIKYISKPLEKNRSKEFVICIKQDVLDKHNRFLGFNSQFKSILSELKRSENIEIVNRLEATRRIDLKQLVSYVLLEDKDGNILSYVRGSYGQKESLLKGVLCIGFGGHVNALDYYNVFSQFDAGISSSAYREIYEEVKGLIIPEIKLLGIINDDTSSLGHNHLAFVFSGKLPTDFEIQKFAKEKAISKLKLLSPELLWKRFHELEFWSQLVLKKLYKRPKSVPPVFVDSKGKDFNKHFLCIVGEIGSGKTEVATFMASEFSLPLLSTRKCVSKLIGLRDFGNKKRTNFQNKSVELISKKEGVEQLASEILKQARKFHKDCVVIDGIRNLETFNIIKNEIPNLKLLYVDVPRDVAFQLFKKRSAERTVTVHEFREARQHEVEKEITLFKTRADAYFFNGGTLNDLKKLIKKWWHDRSKA